MTIGLVILGILGGLGALLAFASLVYGVINLFRQNKLSWGKIVAGFFGGAILSGLAAGGMTLVLVSNADKIADMGEQVFDAGVDTVQGAVSTVTEAGTTAVGEGLEGTVDHFAEKRVAEMMEAAKSMSVQFLGTKSGADGMTLVDVGIKNEGDEAVSLGSLIASGVLVAVDSKGFEHHFEPNVDTPKLLPQSNRRQQLKIKLQKDITVTALKFVGQK